MKRVQNFGREILGKRSLERLIKLEVNFKMCVKNGLWDQTLDEHDSGSCPTAAFRDSRVERAF